MFKNKVILITGAASGIGRATALLMAERGGKIVVSDINEAGGQETVNLIIENGGTAIFVKTDITKHRETEDLVNIAVQTYGRLDVAVNNAGIGGKMQRTDTHDLEMYDRIIAVNQTGVFYCMQHELRQMTQQKSGVIVNVSSMAGLRAQPFASAYAASKHAVNGMTKTAALEFARYNVRVNAVCPAYTETPLVEELLEERVGLGEKLLKHIPMRRWGRPEEIAKAIAFVASEEAAFSTGLCLPIDGGLSA